MRALRLWSEDGSHLSTELDGVRLDLETGFMVGFTLVDGVRHWAVLWRDDAEQVEPVRLTVGVCEQPNVSDDLLRELVDDNDNDLINVLEDAQEKARFEDALELLDDEERQWATRGHNFALKAICEIEEDREGRFVLLNNDLVLAVRTALTLSRDGTVDAELPALVRNLLFGEDERCFDPLPSPMVFLMIAAHQRCSPTCCGVRSA